MTGDSFASGLSSLSDSKGDETGLESVKRSMEGLVRAKDDPRFEYDKKSRINRPYRLGDSEEFPSAVGTRELGRDVFDELAEDYGIDTAYRVLDRMIGMAEEEGLSTATR